MESPVDYPELHGDEPFEIEAAGTKAGINPMFGEWHQRFNFAPVPHRGTVGANRREFQQRIRGAMTNCFSAILAGKLMTLIDIGAHRDANVVHVAACPAAYALPCDHRPSSLNESRWRPIFRAALLLSDAVEHNGSYSNRLRLHPRTAQFCGVTAAPASPAS